MNQPTGYFHIEFKHLLWYILTKNIAQMHFQVELLNMKYELLNLKTTLPYFAYMECLQ